MRHLFLALSIVGLSAGAVQAKQNLRDIKEIDDAVFDVAVADKIRKECPVISARVLKALTLYRSVRSHARSLGFTDDEIEAYGDSKRRKGADACQRRSIFARQWGCGLRSAKLLRGRAQRDSKIEPYRFVAERKVTS